MFNFGMGEMLILAVIALIFIGPKQLPEVARTIARLVNEWRNVTSDLGSSLMEARDVTESAMREAAMGEGTDEDLLKDHEQPTNDDEADPTVDPSSEGISLSDYEDHNAEDYDPEKKSDGNKNVD